MIGIRARNVNDGLYACLAALNEVGVRRGSRNGEVTYFAAPAMIIYHAPRERCLWNAKRDANPFFHFFESLWMLAGRNDVKYPAQFARKIADYSDDTRSLHGAYGHRWRKAFGQDQLTTIITRLRDRPDDRRSVLQMWDPKRDLGSESKDVPCNTNVYFSVSPTGGLDMTVCNRSNDIVWGCFGANAVHFSFLQEYVASAIERSVGYYWHLANNLHLYDFNRDQVSTVISEVKEGLVPCAYANGSVSPYPLMMGGAAARKTWDEDLLMFLEEPFMVGFRHPFFRKVAVPLMAAWKGFSVKEDPERFTKAGQAINQCAATDWALAARLWLDRREAKNDAR